MCIRDRVSIIHSKGTLDWCYPTFILASTAAAMDKEVHLFFTFYGLKALLKETENLKVSPLGNPGMVLKSPIGPSWFKKTDLNKGVTWFCLDIAGYGKACDLGV